LLVNPSTVHFGLTPSLFKNVKVGHYPPLGIMYIASYLLAHSKHKVEILDMMLGNWTERDLIKEIMDRKPDIVGVSVTSFTIFAGKEVCRIAKKADGGIKTVLGGSHATIYPDETLNLKEVDYIVMGEGEEYFTRLVDSIEKGVPPVFNGIGYKKKGVPHIKRDFKLVENLDSLPFPARQLTDYKRYFSLLGKKKVTTSIMTSRGCPFSCNFCFNQYNGRYRQRSIMNVISEIETCLKLGISEFFFFDELFTLNRAKVLEFCDEIMKRKLKIVFDLRSRVDTIDEETLRRLKLAGCERIQYGVESGTQEILDRMNKRISLEKVRNVVGLTKKIGITTLLDFMYAYPGETKEQIRKTIDFAFDLDPDYVAFYPTTLMPMTKIYYDALKNGFLKTDFWREHAKTPREKIDIPYASETLPKEYIENLTRMVYPRFYFRPSQIVRKLVRIRSLTELRRDVEAGLALAKETLLN